MNEWMAESETGGRKGQKLARHDLLDPGVMDAIARQFGRGAHKYGDRNYQKGYNWSLSYAAAQRHLNAFWGGEDWDHDPFWELEGLGVPHHLDAACFHIMALREFFNKHPEFDDRPKTTKNPAQRASETTDRILAGREQATDPRHVSDIQTSRWQLP